MSRELDTIIVDCKKRMEKLNKSLYKPNCDIKANRALWWSAFNRMNAAINARNEQSNMNWTDEGDFSHLQSTKPMSF